MDRAGLHNLGDKVFTTAVSGEVITSQTAANGTSITYLDRLDGMLASAIEMRFAYGSGGTSVKAWLQTSLDQGQTWVDIACGAFTTSSATKIFNLSALTPKTSVVTPTDGTLSDDSAVDGVLGDRLRVKVTSVGTYAGNTTLGVRAVVR